MPLFPHLEELVSEIDVAAIPSERSAVLQPLIDYISAKKSSGHPVRLNFICTHNSRRSHLSQVWAQAMAYYCGVQNVSTYSGGTERTALYPMVAETLKNSGFEIKIIAQSENPVYTIKYSENEPPVMGFSKKWDDDFNPNSEFAAIMTCSQADEACPYIAWADVRIPITYEDPKFFDLSPQQAEKYSKRSLQIAGEMLYVFHRVANGKQPGVNRIH